MKGNMLRINILLVMILAFAGMAGFRPCMAQSLSELSYEDARQALHSHSALAENPQMLKEISSLAIKNIDNTWLPQISLNAQATWQSDVTHVQIPLPSLQMPEMPKDQYRVSAEISQLLYNGQASKYRRNLEELQLEASTLDVEIQMDMLEQQMDALIFQILGLRRQAKILQWQKEALQARLKTCEKRMENGMSTPGSCALIEANIVQVEQKQTETRFTYASALQQLRLLTGLPLGDSVHVALPGYEPPLDNQEYNRKDLKLFGVQQKMSEIKSEWAKARLQPTAAAFLNAGYGRPGLNMLDPDFKPFLLTGVRLTLPLLQWNTPQHEAEIARQQARLVANQQKNLLQQLDRKKAEIEAEMARLQETLKGDQQLVQLRQQVSSEARSQYENGVITASEVSARLAEEAEARLTLEMHSLMLDYAKLKAYKLINN
ncbi:MAG: TolC family protein [Bacteroidales bacterium]